MKRATAKARAWKATSLLVRRKAADDNGYASCVTCGITKHYKELHAGHFIPKKRGNAIYFKIENIHPQCPRCNNFESGNLIEYHRYMLDMYGQEGIDDLYELSKTTVKFSIPDLLDIEADYRQKLNNLGLSE